MNKDFLESLIPLIYSTFGAGLVRSLFFGSLRRLLRKTTKGIITVGLLVMGYLLIQYYWF